VLIEGESGTGKEMLVRAMHAASPSAKLPFRCSMSAAFRQQRSNRCCSGMRRAPFPGAFDRQIGALQHCDGGTLVLDEVDRLPPDRAGTAARFAQARRCPPDRRAPQLPVDVRLIAASNLPLAELVEAGHFLPELLAAISPTTFPAAAARTRWRHPGTGPPFPRPHRRAAGPARNWASPMARCRCSPPMTGRATSASLQAVLFRAAVFCDGDALTPRISRSCPICSASDSAHQAPVQESVGVMLYTPDGNLRPLEDIEADVIRLAIGHYRGRMTEVARRLGIGRSTLYRKLGELGIDNAAKSVSAASRRPRQTSRAWTVSATSCTRSSCTPASMPFMASASEPPSR
jgi:DNA-binding NtrC family response regulator